MASLSKIRISEEFTTVSTDFIRVATLEESKTAGIIVVPGARCPLLVVHDDGNCLPSIIVALSWISASSRLGRRRHLDLPLAPRRFDLASGCTFDLWADDAPTAQSSYATVSCGCVRRPAIPTVTRTAQPPARGVGAEYRSCPREDSAGAYRRGLTIAPRYATPAVWG